MLNLSLLEKIIDKAIKEKVFPGAVVGVKYGNNSSQVLFSGNYFYLENPLYNKRFDVNKETLFDIASITKLVTATAILILVSRKKLSLDDKINGILKTKKFKEIKIRHVLSHVSGLRLSLSSLKEKSKEEMEKIILSAGPTTKPAEAIWYTDQGYYLLGKVIEIISKKSRQQKIAYGETSLFRVKSIPSRHISLVEFQAIQACFQQQKI